MAKVGTNSAVILEVEPDGAAFQEYDPFEPGDVWGGSLTWHSKSRVEVRVGPYLLDASTPQDASLHYFHGSEAGPWGDHSMDLFVLSVDPDRLWNLPGTSWLAIRQGHWTPVRFTPTGASSYELLPERRVGCAVGRFGLADAKPQVASFGGIYGGRNMDLRIHRFPSRADADPRLEADIDTRDRIAKWSWSDSGGFAIDSQHVRLVGDSCLLYPLDVHQEEP